MSYNMIVPDYLSIDYKTYRSRHIEVLQNTEQFRDYNFEGSNIALLLEWHAYNNELNSFYLNKIVKNLYDDTVDLYENAHRLAKFKGYNPKGYISSKAPVIINIKQQTDDDPTLYWSPGDIIYIQKYHTINTDLSTALDNSTGASVAAPFITDDAYQFVIPTEDYEESGYNKSFSMTVGVRQGVLKKYKYTGKDIISNTILLPFKKFDHGDVNTNTGSVVVSVDGVIWTRVNDFFEGISGVKKYFDTDNVYTFNFDKYKRYTIEFSSFRNKPSELAEIEITLIETVGEEGNVGANMISAPLEGLVYNLSKNLKLPLNNISVANPRASQGGATYQSLEDVSNGGKANMHSQERCVTRPDYINYITARADIENANVYGEQELAPKGDVRLYNKTYISVIPSTWSSSTIEVEGRIWQPKGFSKPGVILLPTKFGIDLANDLTSYLEPRKWINSHEEYIIPDLVYFAFMIGLKVKRLYNFVDVANTLREKMAYYFNPLNRSFNEVISFLDMHNFLLDTTERTQAKKWDLIKGIDNIVFRDIQVSVPYYDEANELNIYPPNTENLFPQYTRDEFISSIDNKMKLIKLGFNQFPVIANDLVVIDEEK